MNEVRTDYDGAWKEGVEQYFEEFLAFFFPEIQAEIDWKRGYDFLDQELQQLMRESEVGKQYVAITRLTTNCAGSDRLRSSSVLVLAIACSMAKAGIAVSIAL